MTAIQIAISIGSFIIFVGLVMVQYQLARIANILDVRGMKE